MRAPAERVSEKPKQKKNNKQSIKDYLIEMNSFSKTLCSPC